MRYLLLALMITLLPVRGWVGNAMAVDMASQQALQAQAEGKASAAMPEDCPMHAGAAAGAADDTATAAGHCNDCDTCELCLALASFSWPSGAMGGFTPAGQAPSGGHPFSSAEGGTRLKPPIS
ncbi:MAG: hypothetical protein ACK4VX_15585 [Polaromonas sp.]